MVINFSCKSFISKYSQQSPTSLLSCEGRIIREGWVFSSSELYILMALNYSAACEPFYMYIDTC